MKTLSRFGSASLLSVLILLSCSNPLQPARDAGGRLTIAIHETLGRTLAPSISMAPASYVVAGTGPSGLTFSKTLVGTASITIEKLVPGSWAVSVEARNADETPIGSGENSVTISASTTASTNVTVKPFEGLGTLDLNLSWDNNAVLSPEIEASLLPSSGPARSLDFTIDAQTGTAVFLAGDVPTGFHTITLKLKDGSQIVSGLVETVRIVKDQVVTGNLHFDHLNPVTGNFDLAITPSLDDPLNPSIAGALATTMVPNQALDLTASVSDYAGNVTSFWYVNGVLEGSGPVFSFEAASESQGNHYRIDLVVFSADGKRAGSTHAQVTVVQQEATSYSIGSLGPAGGRVFYDKGFYSDGWRYLEAAPYDQSAGLQWYNGTAILIGTSTSIGTGQANTSAIIAAQGVGWYAASLCDELVLGDVGDWFLPSVDEMTLMYSQLKVNSLGQFASAIYWSSSQASLQIAKFQDFTGGQPGDGYTWGTGFRVRAARGF